jgi:hypothetical protein
MNITGLGDTYSARRTVSRIRAAPTPRLLAALHLSDPVVTRLLSSPSHAALQRAASLRSACGLCAWIQLKSKAQAELTHPKSMSSARSHPSLSLVSLPTLLSLASLLALPFSSSRSEKRRQQGKQLAVATL